MTIVMPLFPKSFGVDVGLETVEAALRPAFSNLSGVMWISCSANRIVWFVVLVHLLSTVF